MQFFPNEKATTMKHMASQSSPETNRANYPHPAEYAADARYCNSKHAATQESREETGGA
jgi:hypothetical protein